jgi:hypothetical protein
MRLAEGHAMTDIAMAPRRSGGREPARAALTDEQVADEQVADEQVADEQVADELLGKAQAEGVELLGPDALLSQVNKVVLASRPGRTGWRVGAADGPGGRAAAELTAAGAEERLREPRLSPTAEALG